MKRFIAMILVCLFACSMLGAYAEAAPETTTETAAAASEGFSFRNGITWGMTPDEVRSAEGREDDSFREDGGIAALTYGYTDVSKYTADYLLYLFSDNKLVEATYIFTSSWSPATAKYINGALTQLYGDPTEMTADEISSEMSFYSGFDGSAITSASGWTTENALIRIAIDSELDITYLDPEFTGSAFSNYNTAGL